MTTRDIVVRLREWHQAERECGGDYMTYGPGLPLAGEAADTITTLRARVAELEGVIIAATMRLEPLLQVRLTDLGIALDQVHGALETLNDARIERLTRIRALLVRSRG